MSKELQAPLTSSYGPPTRKHLLKPFQRAQTRQPRPVLYVYCIITIVLHNHYITIVISQLLYTSYYITIVIVLLIVILLLLYPFRHLILRGFQISYTFKVLTRQLEGQHIVAATPASQLQASPIYIYIYNVCVCICVYIYTHYMYIYIYI